jgi:hypothetical protein
VFQSTTFTNYPPADIETIDATDVDNPKALDQFLTDHDIVNIIQEQLDEDDLDEDFYSKYPAFAKKIWSEQTTQLLQFLSDLAISVGLVY